MGSFVLLLLSELLSELSMDIDSSTASDDSCAELLLLDSLSESSESSLSEVDEGEELL